MKNAKWTREEVILLVDMFFRIEEQGLSINDECEKLSVLLREMNPNLSSNDKTYRNLNGIMMKYQNIRYLVCNEGLSACSKLDKEIVDTFLQDRKKFDEELRKIDCECK